MTFEMIILLSTVGLVGLLLLVVVLKKLPRRLKSDHYMQKWQELQLYCKNKETWPQALLEADKLLDSALKKRRFSGRSMGERMVTAQKAFTNNDMVWFAHNMCKKLINDPELRLKESEVKDALVGFRQALRDLGALPGGENK